MNFKYYRCVVCGNAFPEAAGKYGCCEKAAIPIPLTGKRDDHHPDCCCENNPDSDEPLEVVHASECCPVHNQNPVYCHECDVCVRGKKPPPTSNASDYDPQTDGLIGISPAF